MNQNAKDARKLLAQLVVEEIGGVRKTARLLESKGFAIKPGDVTKWNYPKERKGCAGNIPWRLKPAILELAEELQLDITPRDLVLGYRKVGA